MAPLKFIVRRLRALVRSDRGVSAVEFALILPVMLLLYAGGVELSEALSVDRKVNRVSSTICDLVSQVSNVSASDMKDIFDASAAILEPYSTGSLKMQILVVDIGSSKQTVNWSKSRSDSVYAKGVTSPIAVPSAIAVVGTQVVIARVRYSYESPFGDLMKTVTGRTTYDLEHVFMMRPRLGTAITYTP